MLPEDGVNGRMLLLLNTVEISYETNGEVVILCRLL